MATPQDKRAAEEVVDVTPILEQGIGLGISVALGLLGQRKHAALRRLDSNPAYSNRVCSFVAQHALADVAGRDPTEAEYIAMINAVAELGEKEPS